MIAAPSFYAERLGPRFVTHERLIADRLPRGLAAAARRSARIRGLGLGLLARRGAGVAVIRREPGSLPALAVCALPPARRRVFVLELIRRPPSRRRWRRLANAAWSRVVEGPLLRRAAAGMQTTTAREAAEHAAELRLDPARVHHVGWPLREGRGEDAPPVDPDSREVFASGRTDCDWQTLFAAARGAGWTLRVACSRADLGRVRELGHDLATEIRCEIPWDEHDARLRSCAVYALVLGGRGLSAGHVRLMAATEAGAPVVASDVAALDGYVVGGRTAVLVAPGEPARLRGAIDGLLADPGRRERLRAEAMRRASRWTYEEYFATLGTLLTASLADCDSGPGSG